MFDKVCGPELHDRLLIGSTFEEITASWRDGVQRFIAKREDYLLYE